MSSIRDAELIRQERENELRWRAERAEGEEQARDAEIARAHDVLTNAGVPLDEGPDTPLWGLVKRIELLVERSA